MYFYVDESGHTGANLFDAAQPILYYGVLSSKVNVDVLSENALARIRRELGVPRLHASELGNAKLAPLSKTLVGLQKKLDLRFDIYRVAKPDHAIICFFDQVFDQGINPAVTWTGYWTPLRYVLLLKVASLFDEDIAMRAWSARIELSDGVAEKELIDICKILRSRVVDTISDARSRQIITDALTWAGSNANEIYYNIKSKKDLLQITPNVIGFQAVMHGIAAKVKKRKKQPSLIIVDQQTQFNKAQKTLSDFYASVRHLPLQNGPGLPDIDFKGMPTTPISFLSGTESAGLELVDIYLWVFKRFLEGKELAPELLLLIKGQLHRGHTDEISLNAIASRWGSWFEGLPEPTDKEIDRGREVFAVDEKRRLKAVKDSS